MKLMKPMRRQQQGLYIVEFAIVSAVFFFMMFAAMEVARMMFVWSALDSMTQRGARVAAVCPLNDAVVGSVAIYGGCLLYTSPSPRDGLLSRMPSSA